MKTNEKTVCFRVPQSSSLPQSREEIEFCDMFPFPIQCPRFFLLNARAQSARILPDRSSVTYFCFQYLAHPLLSAKCSSPGFSRVKFRLCSLAFNRTQVLKSTVLFLVRKHQHRSLATIAGVPISCIVSFPAKLNLKIEQKKQGDPP